MDWVDIHDSMKRPLGYSRVYHSCPFTPLKVQLSSRFLTFTLAFRRTWIASRGWVMRWQSTIWRSLPGGRMRCRSSYQLAHPVFIKWDIDAIIVDTMYAMWRRAGDITNNVLLLGSTNGQFLYWTIHVAVENSTHTHMCHMMLKTGKIMMSHDGLIWRMQAWDSSFRWFVC